MPWPAEKKLAYNFGFWLNVIQLYLATSMPASSSGDLPLLSLLPLRQSVNTLNLRCMMCIFRVAQAVSWFLYPSAWFIFESRRLIMPSTMFVVRGLLKIFQVQEDFLDYLSLFLPYRQTHLQIEDLHSYLLLS